MPAFVTGIHVLTDDIKDMDGRDRPGDDGKMQATGRHTSRRASLANSARSWMNAKRASGFVPIN